MLLCNDENIVTFNLTKYTVKSIRNQVTIKPVHRLSGPHLAQCPTPQCSLSRANTVPPTVHVLYKSNDASRKRFRSRPVRKPPYSEATVSRL